MSTMEVPDAPPEQPAAPTAAPGGGYAGLRLPDFWSDAPAGWFLYAESQFRIRNITSEVDRFDHLVGALPKSSVRLVIDALESLDRPYSALKQRLLASHELSEFQRIELLFKMEPLGSRKPSELLSHMLEICPRGEERNRFFIFLFLQRLTKELRSHLNDSEQDPVKLAAEADCKWVLHSIDGHNRRWIDTDTIDRCYRSILLVMLTTDSIDPSVKAFFFLIDSIDHRSQNPYQTDDHRSISSLSTNGIDPSVRNRFSYHHFFK
jgi:hypothetical protein